MAKRELYPEKDGAVLKFLYRTAMGRTILKVLTAPVVSTIGGKFMDSPLSKKLIPSFIEKNHIPMEEYLEEEYTCFNDCFTRRIKPEARPINQNPRAFIAGCDGLLSAYRIQDDLVIPVKRSEYSISELLDFDERAEEFRDGTCLVFRLCVNHYHRYAYFDDGVKGKNTFVSGILHTVRPIALKQSKVFVENSREYTFLETEHFGTVAQIEVGAMLVGKIKNHHETHTFRRGEENGMFLYGGSTIIMLVKKDAARFSKQIFEATEQGREIPVKMGERIGVKI